MSLPFTSPASHCSCCTSAILASLASRSPMCEWWVKSPFFFGHWQFLSFPHNSSLRHWIFLGRSFQNGLAQHKHLLDTVIDSRLDCFFLPFYLFWHPFCVLAFVFQGRVPCKDPVNTGSHDKPHAIGNAGIEFRLAVNSKDLSPNGEVTSVQKLNFVKWKIRFHA